MPSTADADCLKYAETENVVLGIAAADYWMSLSEHRHCRADLLTPKRYKAIFVDCDLRPCLLFRPFHSKQNYFPPLPLSIPSLNITMRNCIFSLATISTLSGSASAWTNRRGGGINRVSSVINSNTPSSSFILSIRGGANEYETKYESAKCSAIEKASRKVSIGL